MPLLLTVSAPPSLPGKAHASNALVTSSFRSCATAPSTSSSSLRKPRATEGREPLARISHTASSRDAARNRARSRSESERSADRRNKVKSTGDRRLAESPEGCPGHQRADRISRRAVPAELHENILSKGNSGRNEAGSGHSSRSEVETACSQSSPQGAEGGNSQQKRYEKCGLATVPELLPPFLHAF